MDAKKFGKFIAERRKQLGMTQSGLAKKINVTDKAVSRWETGVGFPDINTLEPLADVLGVTVLELMKSERIDAETISDKSVSEMFSATIELANIKRDRREFIITAIGLSVMALILIALAVFLPSGPTVWGIPFVFCIASGLTCLAYAANKSRKGLPSALWFTAAGVLLAVPIIQILIAVTVYFKAN